MSNFPEITFLSSDLQFLYDTLVKELESGLAASPSHPMELLWRRYSNVAPAINPHADSHLAAFSEWCYFVQTDSEERLNRQIESLFDFHQARRESQFQMEGYYLGSLNEDFGSGLTDEERVDLHGTLDATCFTALEAENLANIALTLDQMEMARSLSVHYLTLKEKVNDWFWESLGYYYGDIDDLQLVTGPIHVGMFWPLLAGLAEPEKAALLVNHLRTPRGFAREHRLPARAASEKLYDPQGGLSAVKSPHVFFVCRGLSRYDQLELSRNLAIQHLTAVSKIRQETGKFWNGYAPDIMTQGKEAKEESAATAASFLMPLLFETVIGLEVNAPLETVVWRVEEMSFRKIEGLKVADNQLNLSVNQEDDTLEINLQSKDPVHYEIKSGLSTRHVDLKENDDVRLQVKV